MDIKISSPLLPLRDIVVFPNMVIPLFVGRDKSISALNEVMKKDKKIILVTQKNSEIDLSLPTNNGITMLGKTTISLRGSSGSEIFISIELNMDIIIYIAIPFSNLLRILSRCSLIWLGFIISF